MSQITIGVGSSANDGTGDDIRTGGQSINSNFTELYARFYEEGSPAKFSPKLPSYTTAELNALTASSYTGALVHCSDGDASTSPPSECLAYCNGTNWLVVSLGNAVGV